MKRENREAKTNDHQSTTQSTKQKSARFEELDQDQMSEIKGGFAWREPRPDRPDLTPLRRNGEAA